MRLACMSRRPAGEAGGFTLLEVLVALALLSIALQLFSANMRGIAASDSYAKAVMTAESKMREVLDDEEIHKKTWSETTNDGYRIDASIAGTEEKRTENLPVELLEVTLTVHWTDGTKERAISLKTMKLVPKKV
jgi:prepilin-type N-terminal cleavage/methylation domain-containing protein